MSSSYVKVPPEKKKEIAIALQKTKKLVFIKTMFTWFMLQLFQAKPNNTASEVTLALSVTSFKTILSIIS